MRLRLRVERNALPPTQALWPVRDTRCTIAQLLQDINRTFPLEGETWGLEDYSVSVGGYECLHYHMLETICRDEDEMVIKPLQWIDIRSRTMNGRAQIAADGRHLVDGVPFGRVVFRDPVRPEINIPPRKKRKTVHDAHAGVQSEEDGALMLMENGEELADDDEDGEDEADADFEDDASSSDESSVEDEDSEDSSSGSEKESDESVSGKTSESESDNSATWDGIPNSQPPTPSRKGEQTKAGKVVEQSAHQPADPPTGSKRKHIAEHEVDSSISSKRTRRSNDSQVRGAGQVQDTQASTIVGQPHSGTEETKKRNARRRDAKKLKNLKDTGVLPQSATLETLRDWQKNSDGMTTNSTDADQVGRSDEEVKSSGHDSKFEKKRQKLLMNLASGGIDVTSRLDDDDEPPEELSSKEQLPPTPLFDHEEPVVDKATAMLTQTSTPRSKLDLAGSKRLVFGSLGVRVPKTQAERDELQKKLAARPRKNLQIDQAASPQTNGILDADSGANDKADNEEEEEATEDWRDKINLTAVECCDEGVSLSSPPFPFHQRWDPQYSKKKQKANKRVNGAYMDNGAKKRKQGRGDQAFQETYDKYNVDGYGDALDYDDPGEEDDDYWEDGALLDEVYDDDGDLEREAPVEHDGFPPLPTKIDELPLLTEGEACTGDFITFTELACDENTEWQPKMVARTAQIRSVSSADGVPKLKSCILQLSGRDLQRKVFDGEGNRVYSKFEMPDPDAEDDGTREVLWKDLGVVRLVSRPEEHEINGA